MPNWCFCSYVVTGDSKQVRKLYNTMTELQEMSGYGYTENGFGNTWMGNLVEKLGCSYKDVYCRGAWSDLYLTNEGNLTFSAETAWDEMSEWRHFVEASFPGIKIYFLAEELSMGIYKTNDKAHKFFEDSCVISTDDDTYYPDTLDEVFEIVSEITGRPESSLETYDDCLNAVKAYNDNGDDHYIEIVELSVVDD